MKERPILFSAPMVRALLDGTKTQTRRALRVQPLDVLPMEGDKAGREWVGLMTREPKPEGTVFRCKFGQPGDRLYVRETFGEVYDWCDHPEMPGAPTERWHIEWKYRADGEPDRPHLEGAWTGWKPSIHMPKAASRILIEVVSVRVERLQDISEPDARAEGITDGGCVNCGDPEPCGCPNPSPDARDAYVRLWEEINGAGSWSANPWVWVVEFKRVAAAPGRE